MEKNFNLDVTITGINVYNFKTDDGKSICGYRVFYYTDSKDDDKNIIGKKKSNIFLSRENLDNIDILKSKIYPIKAKIKFEFVSLDKKPKPLEILFN